MQKINYHSLKLIKEVAEDIFLNGHEKVCYKYTSREDGFIKDYLLLEDGDNEETEEGLYIDEKRETLTLFQLLVELIEQNSIEQNPDVYFPELSYKLIAARLSAGLTQQELAEKLGIFQQNIAQYENGERKPKVARLQEIAKACNVPASKLL